MRTTTPLALAVLSLILLAASPGSILAQQAGIQVQQPGSQTPQAAAPQAAAQEPVQAGNPAVVNFTRVDPTFALGGALAPDVFPSLKQAGFKSVVNMRAANEAGVDVEAESAAARAAGLTYFWLPFPNAAPDAASVDGFLKAVVDPANQPMLLHCARGGRASMFWAIKRVMVDGWPLDKAMNELPELSKMVGAPLRAFAVEYLARHGK